MAQISHSLSGDSSSSDVYPPSHTSLGNLEFPGFFSFIKEFLYN